MIYRDKRRDGATGLTKSSASKQNQTACITFCPGRRVPISGISRPKKGARAFSRFGLAGNRQGDERTNIFRLEEKKSL